MTSGRFLLFGGGKAVRSPGHGLLAGFLAAAGGPNARIVILTAGTGEPAEINEIYWQLLAAIGATNLVAPIINTREDAEQESTVWQPESAKAHGAR